MNEIKLIPDDINNVNDMIDVFIKTSHLNYVKDGQFYNVLKAFFYEFYSVIKSMQKIENGYYTPYADYPFLDKMLADYGLPNTIFKKFNTFEDKIIAISVMKYTKNIRNLDDLVELFASIGITVRFARVAGVDMFYDNFGFGEFMPSNVLDTIIWGITVHYCVEGAEALDDTIYDNFGFGEFYNYTDTLSYRVQEILDFLSYDYIIFQRLSVDTFNKIYT
jgi:hypothetical protein